MRNPHEIITPHEKLTEAELEAYNLLVPEYQKGRIDIREELVRPKGPYSMDEIEIDESEIRGLEAIFEEEGLKTPFKKEIRQRAELFEALLAEQIELDEWLGENAQTIIPSRFDDVKRGIDMVIEFTIAGFVKHLGLSIDVTTSIQGVAEKIDKIRGDIQHGHLASLKYFYSEQTGNRGVLENIPQVVIGADFRSIREIAGLWLNIVKLKNKKMELERERGLNCPESLSIHKQIMVLKKRLANHRLQVQILEEIKAQLIYFQQLATAQERQEREVLAQKFQSVLETISSILSAKLELSEEDRKNIEGDLVYQAIMQEIL